MTSGGHSDSSFQQSSIEYPLSRVSHLRQTPVTSLSDGALGEGISTSKYEPPSSSHWPEI